MTRLGQVHLDCTRPLSVESGEVSRRTLALLFRIRIPFRGYLHVGKWPRKCRLVCIVVPCGASHDFSRVILAEFFFPLQYVIMAMHARPVPQDPFNPQLSSDKNEIVRYPSPLIPIRLPIFAAVIWLNDLIVRILSVGESVGKPRHNRVPSNSSERAEEGTGIDLHRIPPGTRKPHQQVRIPGRTVERKVVQNSDRRKRD